MGKKPTPDGAQVLVDADELAELYEIAARYGRYYHKKRKTVSEYCTAIRRALKAAGVSPAPLEMEIEALARAQHTLDLTDEDISVLKSTTLKETTMHGEKVVPHPVFRVQRDALAALTRHMKALGLTAEALGTAAEESPLEDITRKVLDAQRKAAKGGDK